jgi:hypothetical protein
MPEPGNEEAESGCADRPRLNALPYILAAGLFVHELLGGVGLRVGFEFCGAQVLQFGRIPIAVGVARRFLRLAS